MAKRKPMLATLIKGDPERFRDDFTREDERLRERAAELGVSIETMDARLEAVKTVGDLQCLIRELIEETERVGEVLSYPLPFLMDPELQREDGGPEWKLINPLMKHLWYGVRLPLTAETPMSFEVAEACLAIIHSPAYGRRRDLEEMATMADLMRGESGARSYSKALLWLRRLAWLRACRDHPELSPVIA